jgi:squalene-associated FAD-dependent desaturase
VDRLAHLDGRVTSSGAPGVAVVGGGWAGLAAAVDLMAAGRHVTLFEAAPVPGGRARRVDHAGTALDNGQHLLLGAYGETLRLIARVADPGMVLRRERLRLRVAGELDLDCPALPAPLHLLAGLLRARGLGWGDRWSALRFMTAQRVRGFRAPGPMTVRALLDAHRQTPRLCRLLWEPLCVAALNTPAELADATTFLTVLRDGLAGPGGASDLVHPASHLGALFPEPALAWLAARGADVHLGEAVTAIDPDDGGWRLGTQRREAVFAQVVWATDPVRAARQLRHLPALEATCALIDRLEYEPITTIYLRYGAGTPPLPAAMTGHADGPGQWFFDRERSCGQTGWIGAVISASGSWRTLARDALVTAVHDQLVAMTGPLAPPADSLVITEKRATFRCVPGMTRPSAITPARGLVLAGDYTAGEYPATLEAAVRSGFACARHLLEKP